MNLIIMTPKKIPCLRSLRIWPRQRKVVNYWISQFAQSNTLLLTRTIQLTIIAYQTTVFSIDKNLKPYLKFEVWTRPSRRCRPQWSSWICLVGGAYKSTILDIFFPACLRCGILRTSFLWICTRSQELFSRPQIKRFGIVQIWKESPIWATEFSFHLQVPIKACPIPIQKWRNRWWN